MPTSGLNKVCYAPQYSVIPKTDWRLVSPSLKRTTRSKGQGLKKLLIHGVTTYNNFIMLLNQHVLTDSNQTNQSMNRMIAHMIHNFSVCYKWERYMTLQRQISSTFVIVSWVQYNQNYRWDRDIVSCESLVRYDLQKLLTILAQFFQCTLKQLHI